MTVNSRPLINVPPLYKRGHVNGPDKHEEKQEQAFPFNP